MTEQPPTFTTEEVEPDVLRTAYQHIGEIVAQMSQIDAVISAIIGRLVGGDANVLLAMTLAQHVDLPRKKHILLGILKMAKPPLSDVLSPRLFKKIEALQVKRNILAHGLFERGPKGWQINSISLGNITRETWQEDAIKVADLPELAAKARLLARELATAESLMRPLIVP